MIILAVRWLRAWYALRERLGVPRRVPVAEFDGLRQVVLLAGSPWVIWPSTSTSAPQGRYWITSTTWPVRQD